VSFRSTSIPLLGVLALLVATAALPYIHPASNAGAVEPRNVLGEVERATVELFERVSPSVVAVSVIVAPDDPAKFHIATGSGFVWDAAGNIVTNAHVVQDAGTIILWLASGEDLDGPLLDSSGRVIGVISAYFRLDAPNTALGFAIPVDAVSRIAPELIAKGRIPTAGIGIVPADDAATPPGIDGVVVARVRPGSPAERSGLRGANAPSGTQGDIITAANGVAVRSPFDLTNQLERVGIGRPIDLAVRRDGKTATMAVDVIDVDPRR
jgi:S1-C subfamily serine protease